MEKTNKQKQEKGMNFLPILIIIIALIIPLGLNAVLQIPAFVPIIGDSVSWLTFWGGYISSIASFFMVYYAYRTIKLSRGEHEQNMRLTHHRDLREAMVKIQDTINHTKIENIIDELSAEEFTQAKKDLLALQQSYNVASTTLTYVLVDLDELDGEQNGRRLITKLNKSIRPIMELTKLMIGYAVLKEGIEQHRYKNMSQEEVINVQDEDLKRILNSNLCNDPHLASCMEIQLIFKKINWDEISSCFQEIYEEDQKKTMSVVMMAFSSKII